MTRVAYLDCFSGISGDMLLGALVDAGAPVDDLRRELSKMPLAGYRLEAEETARAGLRAMKASVVLEEAPQPHRRLSDIESLIGSSGLNAEDCRRAIAVFQRLASAEARVHGVEPEDVQFHEVGAVDAIVDVIGAVVGLRLLEIDELYCSALPAGGGSARGSHGEIPVPGPATLELLAEVNAPLRAGPDIEMELVTPTGAAIACELARFERPAMSVQATGYGAGGRDIEGRPNVLRLWVGDRLERPSTMLLVETNIDDMSPELYAYATERLFEAGARDVWLTSVQMKKNRPGVLLSVLCPIEREDAIARTILRETSTLGMRVREVRRHEAEREIIEFESSLGPVAVKVKRLPGEAPVYSPEYEVCARIAQERGLPLAEVFRIVEAEAQERVSRG
jgi:pyridinium-3,5-bisthiocarboxylic acid mononucleotide nickel chelatase